MSVSSFLVVDKWIQEEGKLDVSNEVTVDGEKYIGDDKKTVTTINIDSYWAKVVWHVGGGTTCIKLNMRMESCMMFTAHHNLLQNM
jgi:hypothetical protein